MSAPVNLNKVRKARAKVMAKARADENVVKHGRSKGTVAAQKDADRKAKALLDGHKRET